jgi:hypothetical protein
MMTGIQESKPEFVICINTDDPDLLTPRMIYEVVPDENAANSNYLRVIDNEGEDYRYPFFAMIEPIIEHRAKHAPRVLEENPPGNEPA